MGRILMTVGGAGGDNRDDISSIVITITDNAGVAEGAAVTAACNDKTWQTIIKNGTAKLYTNQIGEYTITAVTAGDDPQTYSTMLICPYFGHYATDIYSGTLVVTCTDSGGNGKSCKVQSCDDGYEPTNSYNLTQVFDSSLELVFLGIPAGKYLITLDNKYVFLKEITSIQTINTAQVELKQWLYKAGDQCQWNTGGWIKCLVEKTTETRYANVYGGGYNYAWTGTAEANADIAFSESEIDITANGAAVAHGGPSNGKYYYCRGGMSIDVNLGTSKVLDASAFGTLHVTSTGGDLTASFRSGDANDNTITYQSPTVVLSGTAGELKVNGNCKDVFLVLGIGYSLPGQGEITQHSTGQHGYNGILQNVTYNNDAVIMEIWLD